MKTAARSIAYYDTESTHLLFWFETHREGEQLHIRTLLNVLLDLVFIFDVFFFSPSSEPRWVPLGRLLEWLLLFHFLPHIKRLQVIH